MNTFLKMKLDKLKGKLCVLKLVRPTLRIWASVKYACKKSPGKPEISM